MSDRPDLLLTAYIALCLVGGLLIMSTIKMVRDSRFLDIREPRWMNLLRCCALAVMGFGILLAARWHVQYGYQPWMPEMFVLVGLDLYLGAAVLSSHLRMRATKYLFPVKA